MATEFCTKCKLEHPGRECDFQEGECAETKAGSTVHAPGCECGFCKAGFTKF